MATLSRARTVPGFPAKPPRANTVYTPGDGNCFFHAVFLFLAAFSSTPPTDVAALRKSLGLLVHHNCVALTPFLRTFGFNNVYAVSQYVSTDGAWNADYGDLFAMLTALVLDVRVTVWGDDNAVSFDPAELRRLHLGGRTLVVCTEHPLDRGANEVTVSLQGRHYEFVNVWGQ